MKAADGGNLTASSRLLAESNVPQTDFESTRVGGSSLSSSPIRPWLSNSLEIVAKRKAFGMMRGGEVNK
jgi:hypothetical protein